MYINFIIHLLQHPLSYKSCSSHGVIFRGCYDAMETYNLRKIYYMALITLYFITE